MDLTALQHTLREFAAERDWQPFHTPKNLAMALMIEAAELAEIFQWMTPEQSQAAHHDHVTQERISDEVADVLLYLLQVADHTAVDLKRAVGRKLVKNARKHPPVKPGVPVGPRDTALPQTHVLVDWENVQPRDVDIRALVSDVTDVWLFHGPSQRNVDRDQTAFGDRVTCVPISRAGKNALDFHLSFYMGYIASRNPAARFVVLSNDKGYGPMLEHAVDLGFSATLVGFDKTGRRRAPARGPARPAPRPADGRKPASQARRGAPLAVPAAPPPAERRGRNRGRGGEAAARGRSESVMTPLAEGRREAGPAARPAEAARRGRRDERAQPRVDEDVRMPAAVEAAERPPVEPAPMPMPMPMPPAVAAPATPAAKRSRRRTADAPAADAAVPEPVPAVIEADAADVAAADVPARKAARKTPARKTATVATRKAAARTTAAQADAASEVAAVPDAEAAASAEPAGVPARKARAARKTSPRAAAGPAAAAAASTPAPEPEPAVAAEAPEATDEAAPAPRSRARKTAAKSAAKTAAKTAVKTAAKTARAGGRTGPEPTEPPAAASAPAATPEEAPAPPSADTARAGNSRRRGRATEADAGAGAAPAAPAPRPANPPRATPDTRRMPPPAAARQPAPAAPPVAARQPTPAAAPAPRQSAASPAPSRPFDLEKSLRHVEASLRKTANKPTRRARLMATIRSLLGQWADDATTQAVLQRLLSSGRVSIDGQGAVAYAL